METRNEFAVDFPIEMFERWVREEAKSDGIVLEYQDLAIGTMTYNQETGYVNITGDIISRIDA